MKAFVLNIISPAGRMSRLHYSLSIIFAVLCAYVTQNTTYSDIEEYLSIVSAQSLLIITAAIAVWFFLISNIRRLKDSGYTRYLAIIPIIMTPLIFEIAVHTYQLPVDAGFMTKAFGAFANGLNMVEIFLAIWVVLLLLPPSKNSLNHFPIKDLK